jgi:hypothetical protein
VIICRYWVILYAKLVLVFLGTSLFIFMISNRVYLFSFWNKIFQWTVHTNQKMSMLLPFGSSGFFIMQGYVLGIYIGQICVFCCFSIVPFLWHEPIPFTIPGSKTLLVHPLKISFLGKLLLKYFSPPLMYEFLFQRRENQGWWVLIWHQDVKGPQTVAFNLPNDERIVKDRGTSMVMLKNVSEAKYNFLPYF